MKAFDTNVLLRYILQDDKRQSALADRFVESCTSDRRGYINLVVLIELLWVFKTRYSYDKTSMIAILEKLLKAQQLEIENADAAAGALEAYRKHNIDFADALIAAINKQAGYSKTATFDKNAAKWDGFELLN